MDGETIKEWNVREGRRTTTNEHKNGTAERMIWTLNTKARSMMWDVNVLIKFWSEAMRTACYLQRRSPTSSLSGNPSPYEALYSTIPKIAHLRRFGCRVYKHIPPTQRTEKKFGNRSRVCMILDRFITLPSSEGYGTSTREEPGERWNAQVW
jgi:hypothetical protein